MPTQRLVRWGAAGGLLAGIAWLASGVMAFVFLGGGIPHEGSQAGGLIEWSHTIAEGAMLIWLLGSHVRQAPRYGWLGTGGFVISFVGTALLAFITLLAVVATEAVSEGVFTAVFVSGVFGWLGGFLLLGIATFRAKVLPRWCGALLVAHPLLVFSVLFVGSYNIFGLVGLLWLALGYGLWAWRDVPAEQPTRVR